MFESRAGFSESFIDVYVYPNPATGGRNPVFHLECGVADSVEIRIYDIAGSLVHEARLDGVPAIVDGKYAYEYSWNASGVASGVYIYVAIAKKSGAQDLRVRKKVAIIR